MMQTLLIAVVMLASLAVASSAQIQGRGWSIDEAQLANFIEDRVAEQHIPGLAAAVVVDGDVVWAKGFGYADLGARRPVTPDTLFVMASVSKTMVAAGLMHAVEHGALGLDTDLSTILPFPARNPHFPKVAITARHLATHTSGIIDNDKLYGGPASYHYGGDNPISLGAFLAAYLTPGGEIYDEKENFSGNLPGTKWQYSNVGAGLAGYAVESATGMSFDAYCRKYIFDPLGMVNTGWHQRDVDMSRHAIPYAYKDGQFVPYRHYGLATWPDGGLRTSVVDLGRFLGMIMEGGSLHGVTILKPASVQSMLKPQGMTVVREGVPAGSVEQAIFWIKSSGPNGEPPRYQHSGGDPGTSTFVAFEPDKHVGVLVFANTDGTKAVDDSLREIMNRLFKATKR
jgi:CubicO group peptidase (beta-lactamase class C family)